VTRPPEFDELVGGDVPREERNRLRGVHDLLLAAGPPPELTPALAEPPSAAPGNDDVRFLPRRRAGALLSLAAALALIAFLGGYLAGRRDTFKSAYKVHMHATAAAPGASALIDVAAPDSAGNRPLLVRVHKLKPLGRGGYYEMYLTSNGKRLTCGSFVAAGQSAELRFTVPYKLHRGVGWIVTSHPAGTSHRNERVVLTT
jgi:hypothetical protein